MNTKIASFLLVLSLSLAGCQSTQGVDTSASTDTMTDTSQQVEQKPMDKPDRFASQDDNRNVPPPVEYVDPYQKLLEVRTIFFDFDRSELRPEDQQVVAAHARYLKENPNTRIRLEGHADERGSREYNIGLGERRAQTVRRNLALQGAGSNQLATRSFGEEKPLDNGHSDTSWQLNRRVELVYY